MNFLKIYNFLLCFQNLVYRIQINLCEVVEWESYPLGEAPLLRCLVSHWSNCISSLNKSIYKKNDHFTLINKNKNKGNPIGTNIDNVCITITHTCNMVLTFFKQMLSKCISNHKYLSKWSNIFLWFIFAVKITEMFQCRQINGNF